MIIVVLGIKFSDLSFAANVLSKHFLFGAVDVPFATAAAKPSVSLAYFPL